MQLTYWSALVYLNEGFSKTIGWKTLLKLLVVFTVRRYLALCFILFLWKLSNRQDALKSPKQQQKSTSSAIITKWSTMYCSFVQIWCQNLVQIVHQTFGYSRLILFSCYGYLLPKICGWLTSRLVSENS